MYELPHPWSPRVCQLSRPYFTPMKRASVDLSLARGFNQWFQSQGQIKAKKICFVIYLLIYLFYLEKELQEIYKVKSVLFYWFHNRGKIAQDTRPRTVRAMWLHDRVPAEGAAPRSCSHGRWSLLIASGHRTSAPSLRGCSEHKRFSPTKNCRR